MSGPMGEMSSLLKQAQQMQKDLDRVLSELAELEIEGTAGGGAVTVTVTGDRQVKAVAISDEALRSGDKSMLEDLIVAALRDGLGRARATEKERMGQVTGGVDLPGFS